MGRPKTVHKNLPPRMTARRNKGGGLRYYYGQEKIPLGPCELKAIHRWTLIEAGLPIDNSKLLAIEDLRERAIPVINASGVYFLMTGGIVMYVGQSTNLWRRIEDHKINFRGFDSYAFLPCPAADLGTLEARYIDKFQPPWNIRI